VYTFIVAVVLRQEGVEGRRGRVSLVKKERGGEIEERERAIEREMEQQRKGGKEKGRDTERGK
jgi:hypothetical protein